MEEPLTAEWLSEVGFKWHQFERQPDKQWLLWLGDVFNRGSRDDLGIELARSLDDTWFCWLRADYAGRYSRFLHIRHLRTRAELIRMIEGLTGQAWNPENNRYGSMLTPEHTQRDREEAERLDRRIMLQQAKLNNSLSEKDDTRSGALPEHAEAYAQAHK